MRDTRKTRELALVLLTAGIGAIIGDFYLKPILSKQLGVKKK